MRKPITAVGIVVKIPQVVASIRLVSFREESRLTFDRLPGTTPGTGRTGKAAPTGNRSRRKADDCESNQRISGFGHHAIRYDSALFGWFL